MLSAVRILAEKIKGTGRQVEIQRALIATRAHRATEGEPPVIRRAKVLAAVLSEVDIRIEEGELIVGNFVISGFGGGISSGSILLGKLCYPKRRKENQDE